MHQTRPKQYCSRLQIERKKAKQQAPMHFDSLVEHFEELRKGAVPINGNEVCQGENWRD
jgi:hypothetical protein